MTRLKNAALLYPRPSVVPEGSVVTVFRVPESLAGQRLDLYLRGELRRTSRTRTREIILHSAFNPSGKRLKPNHRVASEEHILLWRPPWDEVPVPTEIPILFEDDHLLVVNKPANLPVHPTARYYRNTLIKLLQAARSDPFLSLGHRLDRETSGVLVLVKTHEADRAFKGALEERDGIEKRYLAITWGAPRNDSDPSARAFRFEGHMELDPESPLRVRMRMSPNPAQPGAMHSSTFFRVLGSTSSTDENCRYSLVECLLETGRQHQIRLHLATAGAAIVGDKLYGPDPLLFARGADGELTEDDLSELELPRHALHAYSLALRHPITGTPIRFTAPIPSDLRDFWRLKSGKEPLGVEEDATTP